MRLRAMISSTIADMAADRFKAAEVLDAIGFETLLSERAGSAAAPPEEWCEAAARECDLFILLLGPKYGWIIPDYDISVVEYEFDVAKDADRTKVLVFLRQAPAAETDARQAVFIERVCDFRSGHFRATPYRDVDDLAERLKADVTHWLQARLEGARFAPEGIALLTARRPLRTAVLDLWIVLLGAIIALFAIGSVDPIYGTAISWSQDLSWQRVAWMLTEAGLMLAESIGSLVLGVSLALGIVTVLVRFSRKHISRIARFLSGSAAGLLFPVSLIGPIWFGFSRWQVIFLGMILVCSMSLSRFARFLADLGSYGAIELLVSFLATGAWVPSFLAVVSFATIYSGFFIGGGLLEVWIMANNQLLEGIKLVTVVVFLGSLWSTISVGGLVLRQLARFLLVKRMGRRTRGRVRQALGNTDVE